MIFIVAGLFFVDWRRLAPLPALTAPEIGAGALLLIYAYGGYEVMGVPAGEEERVGSAEAAPRAGNDCDASIEAQFVRHDPDLFEAWENGRSR